MSDFVKKVSQKISKLSSEQVERIIETLSKENSTTDSILESLATGLLIVDADWKLLLHNKSSERLLPFKVRLSDVSKENAEVWLLVDDNGISSYLKKCAQESLCNVSEEFSIADNSNVRFVTITVLPLVERTQNDSRIVGSIITIDDVTEKRQQEILLHRMESLASLTNLAASVAHEIKNPLGAISIHIQLLQRAVKKAREGDGLLPEEKFMEHYLKVVNEEIDNLNKIVLDFLFAVRPVQANMTLSSPDALIENFASLFRPEFESKGVSFRMNLSKTPVRLLIDEKLFREVLINITQNALFAINERFSARAENFFGELVMESSVRNEQYQLVIADNGIGMDEKTASRIFEPYYSTKANGTGLGLTTVYKIIKEFRGDISVTSVPSHGTAFTIRLPLPQNDIKLLPS